LVDVLRQISQLAPAVETGRAASAASEAILRDLVAASSMIDEGAEEEDEGDKDAGEPAT